MYLAHREPESGIIIVSIITIGGHHTACFAGFWRGAAGQVPGDSQWVACR